MIGRDEFGPRPPPRDPPRCPVVEACERAIASARLAGVTDPVPTLYIVLGHVSGRWPDVAQLVSRILEGA